MRPPRPRRVAVASARVPGGRPAMAGGSPEADDRPGAVAAGRGGDGVGTTGPAAAARTDRRRQPEVVVRGGAVRRATVAFGIYPDPLFDARPRRGRGDRLARLGAPAACRGRGRDRVSPARIGRAGGEFRARGAYAGCGTSPSTPAPRRRPGVARVRRAARARGHGARRGRAGGGVRGGARAAGRAVVRTGVCIVGGDVCRASDAAAAGLAPCTLSDRRRGGGLAVTVLSVRVGGDHQWLVARRSDGSVAVTKLARDDLGASGGPRRTSSGR